MEVEVVDLRNSPTPGTGQGVGLPKRGEGGRDSCKCPVCGTIVSHSRGLPCTKQKCPKCGSPMVGA